MRNRLVAKVAVALTICSVPIEVYSKSKACIPDREVYFWYVLAESQPRRSIYYSPRDQEAEAQYMGLEAALRSCEREDCTVGISADSDAEAIDMLQAVCERRIRPDAYRHIQVHVFVASPELDISDRFAACTAASVVTLTTIEQFLQKQPEAIEGVRCDR